MNVSILRRPAWVWYLGIGSLVTAMYMFVPPLKGNGPLINVLGLSGVVAVMAGGMGLLGLVGWALASGERERIRQMLRSALGDTGT